MRETKTAWTRLSERMPDEYPCLFWSDGGIFPVTKILDVRDNEMRFQMFPGDEDSVAFAAIDCTTWAPIPK